MVERVLDKARANFCELFDPTDNPAASRSPAADELLDRAKDLFK
jgi:hypothetical protein